MFTYTQQVSAARESLLAALDTVKEEDIVDTPRVTFDMVAGLEPHAWIVEASDLGIPPGQWPLAIETELGNGHPFRLKEVGDEFVTYWQDLGLQVLRIFRD